MSYTPLNESSERSRSALGGTFRSASRAASELSVPLTSIDSEDPYYVFREDLQRKLDSVDESLSEYLRIVHQTDTSVNTHDLKDSKKQLKRHLKASESTLRDLQMTVQMVEVDRAKFSHIDDSELYERRSLVTHSRERIQKAKDEMTSESVKAKMLADERAKAIRRAGNDSLGATNDEQRRNTNYIVDSQARQSLLMQQQDEVLDDLDQAVVRVGHMAEGIHDEIGQQNKMLNELSDDLDKAEEELGLVMGKLAKFLQTKDQWQICTILSLAATAIVLFFMVLYF